MQPVELQIFQPRVAEIAVEIHLLPLQLAPFRRRAELLPLLFREIHRAPPWCNVVYRTA